ncbi:hypothetical protein HanIR_Chr12g0574091 [Helianthus annuus]|nr:hypothetical protein HanIR_Chr12g0574091 [Helianthus annuus]
MYMTRNNRQLQKQLAYLVQNTIWANGSVAGQDGFVSKGVETGQFDPNHIYN